MKQLLIISTILLATQLTQAQSYVTYSYDNAGNRTARQTIILKNTEDKNYKENEISEVNDIFEKGNITVYPNPVNSILSIQFTDINTENEIVLQLYDISGKLLKTKKTRAYNTQMDLSDNTAGVYILKIVSGNSRAEFTVVKE